MKCVLDPNVLVSALLSRRGTPAELIRLWVDGAFELIASPLLLEELERVLNYPKIRSKLIQDEIEAFLALLTTEATISIDPAKPPSTPTADAADDYLVVLAEAERTAIVSGDKHLLDMSDRLPVYSPAVFLQLLRSGEGPQ